MNSITLTGNLLITVPMLALGIAAGSMSAFAQLSSSITSTFSSGAAMAGRAATQMASSPKTEFTGADQYDGGYTRNYDIANNNVSTNTLRALGSVTAMDNQNSLGDRHIKGQNAEYSINAQGSYTDYSAKGVNLSNVSSHQKTAQENFMNSVTDTVANMKTDAQRISYLQGLGFSESTANAIASKASALSDIKDKTAEAMNWNKETTKVTEKDGKITISNEHGESVTYTDQANFGVGLPKTKIGVSSNNSENASEKSSKSGSLSHKDSDLQKEGLSKLNQLSKDKGFSEAFEKATTKNATLTDQENASNLTDIAKQATKQHGEISQYAKSFVDSTSVTDSLSSNNLTRVANSLKAQGYNEEQINNLILNAVDNINNNKDISSALSFLQSGNLNNTIDNDVKTFSVKDEVLGNLDSEYQGFVSKVRNNANNNETFNNQLDNSHLEQEVKNDLANMQNNIKNGNLSDINGNSLKIRFTNEELNQIKNLSPNDVAKYEAQRNNYNERVKEIQADKNLSAQEKETALTNAKDIYNRGVPQAVRNLYASASMTNRYEERYYKNDYVYK